MKLKLKVWKVKTYIVAKEFFQYSLFTYLIILTAEIIKKGIVSYFFNTNILLAVVILSGFIMAIAYDKNTALPDSSPRTPKQVSFGAISFSLFIALVGGLLVYADAFDLGIIAIVIGCLAGLLILLLSLLFLIDKE